MKPTIIFDTNEGLRQVRRMSAGEAFFTGIKIALIFIPIIVVILVFLIFLAKISTDKFSLLEIVINYYVK